MFSWLTSLLTYFVPPRDPMSNPEALYRWMIIMSFASSLFSIVFVIEFFWLSGWIPGLEDKAYAQVGVVSQEVAPVKAMVQDLRENDAKREILAMKERQCKADKDNNVDAKRFATGRLLEALENYRKITGERYIHVPECSELM